MRKKLDYIGFLGLQGNQICQWLAAIMSFQILLSDFVTTDKNKLVVTLIPSLNFIRGDVFLAFWVYDVREGHSK